MFTAEDLLNEDDSLMAEDNDLMLEDENADLLLWDGNDLVEAFIDGEDDEDDEEDDSEDSDDEESDDEESDDEEMSDDEESDDEELDEAKKLSLADRKKANKKRRIARKRNPRLRLVAKKYAAKRAAGKKANPALSKKAKKGAKLRKKLYREEYLTEEVLAKGTEVTVVDDDGNEYIATITQLSEAERHELDQMINEQIDAVDEARRFVHSSAERAAMRRKARTATAKLSRMKSIRRRKGKKIDPKRQAAIRKSLKAHGVKVSAKKKRINNGDDNFQLSEAFGQLFEGQTLTEGFEQKAATIFESAVNTRVNEITDILVEELSDKASEMMTEEQNAFIADASSKLTQFVDYVAEEWMKENQIAIDRGLRTMVAEEFIGGLKKLFVESHFDVPESELPLAEAYQDKAEEYKTRLNDVTRDMLALREENISLKKEHILAVLQEGMAATDASKLEELAESVTFTTDEEYTNKLQTLKESFIGMPSKRRNNDSADPSRQILTEENGDEPTVPKGSDPFVNRMAEIMTRRGLA